MTKKAGEKNRFDDLFTVARAQEPEAVTERTMEKPRSERTGKSADPNYVRTTVYLPKRLHQQLKSAAVQEEREMSGIVEELLEAWLKSRAN